MQNKVRPSMAFMCPIQSASESVYLAICPCIALCVLFLLLICRPYQTHVRHHPRRYAESSGDSPGMSALWVDPQEKRKEEKKRRKM